MRFALVIALCVISTVVQSATLYMGSGETYTNLQAAMAAMSGGDTLIIRDGTYTGTSNQIDVSHLPPAGSAGAYTTIKAENNGAAIFDGENARTMFNLEATTSSNNRYWQFEGIIWCRSTGSCVALNNSSYVKFLRCGAYDAASGNNVNFSVAANSHYVLFEGCYAYGTGRYKFLAYGYLNGYPEVATDHIIFRNCVGRLDGANPSGDPMSVYSIYSADDCLVQNCIAIDSDQVDAWSNVGSYAGAFAVPSTSKDTNRTTFTNCLALNMENGGLNTNGNNSLDAIDTTFTNCVLWDYNQVDNATLNLLRGTNSIINHCTFGASNSYYYIFNSYDYSGHNATTVKNSIFYNHQDLSTGHSMFYDIETYDYNNYYGNEYSVSAAAHDQTLNPIWHTSTNPTGALKYITRIESGSTLSGDADDAGDIGANLDHLIGTAGTLYDDTGYNTDTGTSMWPFPNEDLIKTKMAAYSGGGVSGARGFCTGTSLDGSAQTLTKYIWEYLGNQIPADIYGTTATRGTAGAVTVKGNVR